jgi:hypothetical protein
MAAAVLFPKLVAAGKGQSLQRKVKKIMKEEKKNVK